MVKKRRYGHKELHKNTLIAIYSYLNIKRKEKFNSYEIWAGRSMLSRTIASRISKSYIKNSKVTPPDVSLSTLLHMSASLDIKLSELFRSIEDSGSVLSKDEYLEYINDETNFRD